VLRWLFALTLTIALALPSLAAAQSAPDQPDQPEDSAPPPAGPSGSSGPTLQATDIAPVVCDPGKSGFKFVEVRGSGFDAWAKQRLIGNLTDSSGTPQMQWGSVWVTPQGRLTLEVNLCRDPVRNRAALAPGDYTVAVGAGGGAAIAATSISVLPPADASAAAPDVEGEPAAGLTPADNSARGGPGSKQQPLPIGTSGKFSDGWQFVVTSVNPDAYAAIHEAFPSAAQPSGDQKYVMVSVQAIYVGQGSGVLSAIRLGALGKSGQTYDQIKNGCGVVPQSLPATLVQPGGGLVGNICFAIPSPDLAALTLFDAQSGERDKLYFALT
jgi:hypothetical protein